MKKIKFIKIKKNLLIAIFAIFGLIVNAQKNTNINQYDSRGGSFIVGANIGLPLSNVGDVSSFNSGADIAYLYEVIENLEIGGLIGFTNYFGNGTYELIDISDDLVIIDYPDAGFVPVSSSARYYFSDRKFFGGLDLGFAINVSGDADNGFYHRPKFGFNFGLISLIVSYTGISGGVSVYEDYEPHESNVIKVSGFNSFNVGIEFKF